MSDLYCDIHEWSRQEEVDFLGWGYLFLVCFFFFWRLFFCQKHVLTLHLQLVKEVRASTAVFVGVFSAYYMQQIEVYLALLKKMAQYTASLKEWITKKNQML